MRLFFFILLSIVFFQIIAQPEYNSAGKIYEEYLEQLNSGQFLKARSTLEEMLIYIDDLPEYNQCLIYNNLGLINWNLGQYNESEHYYNEAILMSPNIDDKSNHLKVSIYNNQAILQKQLGKYSIALEYYEKAEGILTESPISESRQYDQFSMIQFNKAVTYFKLHRFNKAIKLFEESLAIKQKYDLSYIGSVYYNLARCFSELGVPNLANQNYQNSINQWIQEYDSSYYELANIYVEYGHFLVNQGKASQGLDYYSRALNNYLTNYGSNHTYTASCLKQIGEHFREQNAYKISLEYLQSALISVCPEFREINVLSNPTRVEGLLDLELLKIYRSKIVTLVGFANLILSQTTDISSKGNSTSNYKLFQSADKTTKDSILSILNFALETCQEAVRVLHRIQGSYLTQESRLYLAENQKDVFIEGIEVAMLLNNISGKDRYIEEAYEFASLGKTLELNFEMSEKEMLYLGSLQDSASTELLALKGTIDSYSNLIHIEQIKKEPDFSNITRWKEKRFDLRRDYESLYEVVIGQEVKMESDSIQFGKGSLSELQSKLGRNKTVIEYSISNVENEEYRKLYAFIITKNDCHIYEARLDTTFVKDIAVVHDHLNEYDPFASGNNQDSILKNSLKSLYESLIEPIELQIDGTHLIIIPDDQIAQIPFDALLKKNKADKSTSTEYSYLVNDYEISYVPNSSFIHKSKYPSLWRTPKLKVIARDHSSLIRDESKLQFLSSVSNEIEILLNILNGLIVPENYTKVELLREIEGGELLHFALHSTPTDVMYSSAYMVLNDFSDSAFNNLLFDYEIDPLHMSASLVVMNACESGSGELYRGEGMLSLSRSFMLAGAKSVVHTLWPVDDKASTSIITEFYHGLSGGLDKSRSLREAKLKYIDESFPTFSHPYYWAGYQLVGETCSVFFSKKKSLLGLGIVIVLILFVASRTRLNRKAS